MEFKFSTNSSFSSLTSLSGGGFLVSWVSDGVFAQRYDSSGMPLGAEFLVNSDTSSATRSPSGSSLHYGGFVVAWSSDNLGIYGQRYDAAGLAIGNEFQVTAYNGFTPSVTSLNDGSFVVTWTSYDQSGNYDVFGQIYNVTGLAIGSEFQINTYSASHQQGPVASSLTDGGFLVTWQSGLSSEDNSQDGHNIGVFGQRYHSSGQTSGEEFQVNTHTDGNQMSSSVTVLNDGGFVITWASSGNSSNLMAPSGNDVGQDGDGTGIFAQRYDSQGLRLGYEFQVNTYTYSSQNAPVATSLNDGGFVVVWSSYSQDGYGAGIFGQRYDSVGQVVGSEFSVNTSTFNDQNYPSVVSLADGGFLVTWGSNHEWFGGGNPHQLFGQRFSAAGDKVELSYGTDGDDTLSGGAGNDVIDGGEGNDTLDGGAGDDTLDGGDGDDEIYGGDGDDIIYTSAGNDIYDGGDGVDTVITDYINSPPTLGGSISLRNIENQFFIGDGNITINRSGDPDSGNNHVKSQGGNDRVLLGVGDDKFELGAGINYSNGGSGNDTIILEGNGTFSSDLVALNISSALQTGTNERINLNGKTRFEDVMDGGADVDTVELTHESDAFFLHDSYSDFHSSLTLSDDYSGKSGTARIENIENINAGGGDDVIDLTSPDYSLAGQIITVDGGEGNDTLWGSDANEMLKGGNGDDELFGGAGINELIGGSGVDEFQFTKTSTNDTIADFDITEGDTLKFFNTGSADFDRDSIALNSAGDELTIAYGSAVEDVLTISLANAGLQLDDLTSDVLFVDNFIL